MRRVCISFPSKISAISAKKRRRQRRRRRRRRRQTPFARSFKCARRDRIKRRKVYHVQFNHLDDRRKRRKRRRREKHEQQQRSRARVFVVSASGQRASKEEKYEQRDDGKQRVRLDSRRRQLGTSHDANLGFRFIWRRKASRDDVRAAEQLHVLDQRRGGKARAGQEESEARVTFDDAKIGGIRKDGGNDGEKFRERTRDDVEI